MTDVALFSRPAWMRVAACLLLAGGPLLQASAAVDPAQAREEVREQIDALRGGRSAPADADALLSRNVLPAVYEGSNFELQWTDPARVASLLRALDGLADDGLNPTDYHVDALRRQASAAQSGRSAGAMARFDLLASDALVLAIYHLTVGKVDPKTVIPDWNFNARPVTDALVLAAVRRAIASGRIEQEFDAARPSHWMYDRGREFLKTYRKLAEHGGWPRVPSGKALKPGMSDARVPALRARLAAEGDYQGPASAGDVYDDALVTAVKAFQERHLLEADGAVGPGTLHEINVSAAERVAQIRVNLERARWVLHEIGDEDHVVVDIAGYGVRYMHGKQPVWQSRVIVGQPFKQTPSFRAEIQYIVFNPTWSVPHSITSAELLPQMRKDPSTLARKNIKVVDRQGREVDPKTLDWAHYNARNFPYFLRQDAGDSNALGKVKIMFPHQYSVYLHDTPTRSLFDRDRRTFSHGCIRVEKPRELVERLLADPVNWNAAAIDAAIATGETKTVNLKKRVPVLLIYWTVDQDASGRTVFKPDAYRQDPVLLKALDDKVSFGKRRAA